MPINMYMCTYIHIIVIILCLIKLNNIIINHILCPPPVSASTWVWPPRASWPEIVIAAFIGGLGACAGEKLRIPEGGISLVVQWLRIHLPMQETRV